jgi:oligopeptide transport system permease protein
MHTHFFLQSLELGGKRVKRYIAQRLIYMFTTLFIIISITFLLMNLLPGTPFSNADKLTEQQLQIMNDKYGLDKPVAFQYLQYVGNLLKGDLGLSFQYQGRSVNTILGERMGPSALIGFQAIVFGVIVGMGLGIIAALRRNSYLDYSSVFIAVLGMSIPNFVFAALLQYYI